MAPNSKPAKLVDEMLSHLKANFVDREPSSKVANFYANQCVFITGATGFIGKALVEKLVRSCPDIKRIYLLIREKRGKDINERLSGLIESQIFNRIKSLQNGSKTLEEKLRAIRGDITLPKFGISASDMKELNEEVSIVFNSAATIRFVEPLDVAVRNNIYSVSQLVEFCDGLANLKAIIHLSTAYSNCHKRDTIYEIFYEPPMSGDQIISAVNALKQIQNEVRTYPSNNISNDNNNNNNSSSGSGKDSDEELLLSDSQHLNRSVCEPQIFFGRDGNRMNAENLSADLLDEFAQIALERSNRPNTYTFTKAISESYLLELVQRKPDRYLDNKIPVVVIRPSIVGGAWREPEVGFVDNYNGPTGAILSLYMGALQAMPGRGERVADLVPVDMVVSMVVCAGWFACTSANELIEKANKNQLVCSDRGAYIFNFVSGFRNPLHWNQVTELIAKLAYKYPVKRLFRLPGSYFVRAGSLYNVYDCINHKLPAKVCDFISEKILRQNSNPRNSVSANYYKIKQMTDTLTPFTSNQWRLSDANVCALYNKLDRADRRLFEFDVENIDWTRYITNYIIGSRIYTLRDEAHNLPEAVRNLKKRQLVARLSVILIALLFFSVFCVSVDFLSDCC